MHKHRHERSIRPGSDGVEFDPSDPRIPVAFRIWRDGVNNSDKGPVKFTDRSREEVPRRFAERGMALRFDYDHESTVPVEDRRSSAREGFGCAANVKAALALRGKELWAESIVWTERAKEQIRSGERTQISPYFTTTDDGEIVELINVGLCFEGATHKGVDFAAAWRRRHARSNGMDMLETIKALRAALENIQAGGGSIEEALAMVSTMEAMASAVSGGGEGPESTEAMGYGAMAEEQQKMAADMGEMKQAMARMERTIAALATGKAAPQAHGRQPQVSPEIAAANLESKQTLCDVIAEKNPGIVSADTVKHYRANGDPEGLRRQIAEVLRDRQAHGRGTGSDARPPKDNGAANGEPLTAGDIKAMARHGLTEEQYRKAKAARSAGKAV